MYSGFRKGKRSEAERKEADCGFGGLEVHFWGVLKVSGGKVLLRLEDARVRERSEGYSVLGYSAQILDIPGGGGKGGVFSLENICTDDWGGDEAVDNLAQRFGGWPAFRIWGR